MKEYKLQMTRGAAVTKSDSAEITDITGALNANGCLLYVGTGGSIKVKTIAGDILTFVNVLSGTFLPIQVKQVYATGSTATDILALW